MTFASAHFAESNPVSCNLGGARYNDVGCDVQPVTVESRNEPDASRAEVYSMIEVTMAVIGAKARPTSRCYVRAR